MKRCLCVLVLLIAATTAVFAAPPNEGLGVGVITGIPLFIGATSEYNFGPAYAGLSLGYFDAFWLRLEGGYNVSTPFVNQELGVDLHLSVGGALDLMFSEYGTLFAIGIPVTWSYTMENIPLKFFVKAGPQFLFGGGMGFYPTFAGSAGGMYVFKI